MTCSAYTSDVSEDQAEQENRSFEDGEEPEDSNNLRSSSTRSSKPSSGSDTDARRYLRRIRVIPSHPPQAPQNFAGMLNATNPTVMSRQLELMGFTHGRYGMNGPSVMERQLELMELAHNLQLQNGLTNNPAQRTNQQPLHPPSHNMGGQPIASSSAGFPSAQAPLSQKLHLPDLA